MRWAARVTIYETICINCYEKMLNFCLFNVQKDGKIRTLRRPLCHYKREIALLIDQHFETNMIYMKEEDSEHIKQRSKLFDRKSV